MQPTNIKIGKARFSKKILIYFLCASELFYVAFSVRLCIAEWKDNWWVMN
jgi:hypothetical protein